MHRSLDNLKTQQSNFYTATILKCLNDFALGLTSPIFLQPQTYKFKKYKALVFSSSLRACLSWFAVTAKSGSNSKKAKRYSGNLTKFSICSICAGYSVCQRANRKGGASSVSSIHIILYTTRYYSYKLSFYTFICQFNNLYAVFNILLIRIFFLQLKGTRGGITII